MEISCFLDLLHDSTSLMVWFVVIVHSGLSNLYDRRCGLNLWHGDFDFGTLAVIVYRKMDVGIFFLVHKGVF